MRFSVLSSGSKANATFIESGATRILVDCGLSARKTEQRLAELGIDPDSISAVVVTHEHSDHIRGIPVFTQKYQIPVYANAATAEFLGEAYAVEIFSSGKKFNLGEITISPVRTTHDAAEPVCLLLQAEGLALGHITDLGMLSPAVSKAAAQADALVLEFNHDPEMLSTCHYAWSLKKRIASDYGHLSNETAADLVAGLARSPLRHLVLAHLSENSNTPELALKTLQDRADCSRFQSVCCASPYEATGLIDLSQHSSGQAAVA